MSDVVRYLSGSEELLAEIKPLWQELNQHHAAMSPHFSGDFHTFTFEQRINKLKRDGEGGTIRIDIANNGDRNVGHVISVITAEGVGEIESIFVLKEFRNQTVGEELMQRALRCMEAAHVKTKIVKVAVGNEAVYPFYARFGFYPRVTMLKQKNSDQNR
jgi:ribosomal protein S18 acetylase RimI-like enzyme